MHTNIMKEKFNALYLPEVKEAIKYGVIILDEPGKNAIKALIPSIKEAIALLALLLNIPGMVLITAETSSTSF